MNIVKHIPNTITSMNLFCGIIGVIFALEHNFEYSFYLMLAAAVFDFFDGLSARALKAYSNIGKELDSLADDVSFGVLPAVMLYSYSASNFNRNISYICLILAVFTALRLAKFNIDERQSSSFLGLPSPASALFCSSLIYSLSLHTTTNLNYIFSSQYSFIILAIILSLLLVSEIPMFSLKLGGHSSRNYKIKVYGFLIISAILSIVIISLGLHWSLAVFVCFFMYIVSNLIFYVIKLFY